jgi:uncharacterized Zn finger protein
MTEPSSAAETGHRSLAGLHAAELPCETCGKVTMHRVVGVGAARRSAEGRIVEGTARCSECRWTHRFRLDLPEDLRIPAVLSSGARSTPMEVRLPPGQRIQVGSGLPGQGSPLRVMRIDLKTGRSAGEARAREIQTVWVAPDVPKPIPVSLVLGPRTAVTHAVLPPEQPVVVGETLSVAGGTLRIVGLRARGRTWSDPDDGFPAREVDRIYTRRTESPPAGASRWSKSREIPSSRTISSSSAGRSRSFPGVNTRRSRPRARRAAGGAEVQRVSPS